jgi:hypothetical protein
LKLFVTKNYFTSKLKFGKQTEGNGSKKKIQTGNISNKMVDKKRIGWGQILQK